MSYDNTTLANMAIGHAGIDVSIGDLATENSIEAIACRRYFDHCRDFLYRLRRWPHAARLTNLSDLGVTGTLYQGMWQYRYNYPNFAMRINIIVNPAMRSPITASNKIPFEVAGKNEDAGGKVILTDQCNAIADYNHRIEDPAMWDAEFAESFSLYLGLRAAKSLRVDKGIVDGLQREWSVFLRECMMIIDSESQPDPERPSQYETVRG